MTRGRVLKLLGVELEFCVLPQHHSRQTQKRQKPDTIGRRGKCAKAGWVKGVIMQYLVVVEEGSSSYGAFVPDLPGCIAVGETEIEVIALIQEAIEFHL